MNSNNTSFTIIGSNGDKVKCEILFTYEDEQTNKHYIAYTDNSVDDEGNIKVFASLIDPDERNPILHELENDSEWELIESILESLTNEEDDYND